MTDRQIDELLFNLIKKIDACENEILDINARLDTLGNTKAPLKKRRELKVL